MHRHIGACVLSLGIVACAPSDATTVVPAAMWLADYAAMVQAEELAEAAVAEGRLADAAAFWRRAAAFAIDIPGDPGAAFLVEAAAVCTEQADARCAREALVAAERRGLRQASVLAGDPRLAPLRAERWYQDVLGRVGANDLAWAAARRDPEAARFEFDDVTRFWETYDRALQEPSTNAKVALFRREYLGRGTPGLVDYHRQQTRDMRLLVERIAVSGGYYEGIRERTHSVRAMESAMRDGLRRLGALYPDAFFPDVTFVIGRLTAGGTVGPTGLLIGVEVWSWTDGVPLDGIPEGFQAFLRSTDLAALPRVVIHEQIHAMQSYASPPSLLRSALAEGSAAFLAGLAVPDGPAPAWQEWGLDREAAIWARFSTEMHGTDVRDWIGNNDRATPVWPADLGYFVGARIAEAYYDRHADKARLIDDLLHGDPQTILDASGYAARFTR